MYPTPQIPAGYYPDRTRPLKVVSADFVNNKAPLKRDDILSKTFIKGVFLALVNFGTSRTPDGEIIFSEADLQNMYITFRSTKNETMVDQFPMANLIERSRGAGSYLAFKDGQEVDLERSFIEVGPGVTLTASRALQLHFVYDYK